MDRIRLPLLSVMEKRMAVTMMNKKLLNLNTFSRLCDKEVIGVLALGIWFLWQAPHYYRSDAPMSTIVGALAIISIWFILSRKGVIARSYFAALPGIAIWMIWLIFAWARVSRILFAGIRMVFGSTANFIILLVWLLLLAWGGVLFLIYFRRRFYFKNKLLWFSIIVVMIGLAVTLTMNRQIGHCQGIWATLFDLPCFLQAALDPVIFWLLAAILLLIPMLMAWRKFQDDSILPGVILSSWAPIWLNSLYYPYQTLAIKPSTMPETLMTTLRSFHVETSLIAISVFLVAIPLLLLCNTHQKLKLLTLSFVPGIAFLSIHLLYIRFLMISGKLTESRVQILSFGIQLLIFWMIFVVFSFAMARRYSIK